MSVASNGWINFVAFSPDCNTICFGTQDCELNFSDVSSVGGGGKAKAKTEKVLLKGNPMLNCVFLGEDKLVASGFDKVPILFKKEGNDWKQTKILDAGVSKIRVAKVTGNAFKDRKVYFNADIKLNDSIVMKETDTKHANYINCMKPFAQDGGVPLILSTSDINGYLNYWDVQNL